MSSLPPLPDSFEEFVVPHLDVLYRVGLSLTRDEDRANDLVQEAVLRAMGAFGKLAHHDNIRSWLVRVVHTTFLDAHRKQSRRPEHEWRDGDEDQWSSQNGVEAWEPQILRQSFDDEIEQALGQLPPGWRTAMMLVDVEGWQYEEVSEALELPIGTVRSRLHRARARMFEELKAAHAARGRTKAG